MSINLIPGVAIESNTITTTQMNTDAWAQVYAALAAANAAYDAANAAYAQANTANSGVTTIISTGTGASLGLVIALS